MSEYVVSSNDQQNDYENEDDGNQQEMEYAKDPLAEDLKDTEMENNEEFIGEDGKRYIQGADGYWYTYDEEWEEGEAGAPELGVGEEIPSVTQDEEPVYEEPESGEAEALMYPHTKIVQNEEEDSREGFYPPPQAAPTIPAATDAVQNLSVNSVLHSVPAEIRIAEAPVDHQSHPYHPTWMTKIVMEIFFSRVFLVYFSILLYSAGGLILMLSLEYSFAILFRLFSPSGESPLEPFGYFAIYIFFTHVVISCFCVLIDMIDELWAQHRGDTVFWGMTDFPNKNSPPKFTYGSVILATTVLPFFWAILETAMKSRSVIEVGQRFADVAVLAALFIVFGCYLIFFGRALMRKRRVYITRYVYDDFILKAKAYRRHPEKMSKKSHWYHASTVLEEFGLDRNTLFYEPVVVTIGLAPILSIYAAQTMATFVGIPSVTWGLIASLGFSCLIVTSWLACLPSKGHWSAYFTIFLIFALFVLGAAGAGTSGSVGTVVVEVVLFILAQALATRKRQHQLTQKEKEKLLNISPSEPVFNAQTWFPSSTPCREILCDPYLCCCQNVAKACFTSCSCCKKVFKERDTFVVREEKLYARRRVALRTDQKYTLAWWIFLLIIIAFAVGLGNALQYNFSSPIARNGKAVTGSNPDEKLCQLSFNSGSSTPFSVLDLALLGALSYSYGTNGDTDFVTWFGQYSEFYRVFPVRLPPNRDYATEGTSISFSHYVDFKTDFHIITLNSNLRGLSLFRSIDDWGAVLALQGAKAISPLISSWPNRYQEAFVSVSGFVHDFFPSSKSLSGVEQYIQDLVNNGTDISSILVVGNEINGGYAAFLAASIGVNYVAFNPPGTKYTVPSLKGNGTDIVGSRSLWSYVDYPNENGVTYFYPCDDSISLNACSGIVNTIEYFEKTCGDQYGRYTVLLS